MGKISLVASCHRTHPSVDGWVRCTDLLVGEVKELVELDSPVGELLERPLGLHGGGSRGIGNSSFGLETRKIGRGKDQHWSRRVELTERKGELREEASRGKGRTILSAERRCDPKVRARRGDVGADVGGQVMGSRRRRREEVQVEGEVEVNGGRGREDDGTSGVEGG